MEQCFHCYTFKDVTLATWVPFFHNLGLVVTICMPLLATASQGYFLQTLRFLENPKLWIRLISDFKITMTVGPGSAYDACTRIFSEEEAAQYSLSQVTHFMNGSEFISARTGSALSDVPLPAGRHGSRLRRIGECLPGHLCQPGLPHLKVGL